MFTLTTLLTITASVTVIFFSPLVIRDNKFSYSNKGKQTTFASRVYKNGRHGLKTYLTQGILLFKIRDQPYFIDTLFVSLEPMFVLIEYVPFGDLLGYLRKSRGLNDTYYKDPDIKPQTNLTSQQLMRFAWQIADGMSYLSSIPVSDVIIL